MPNKFNVFVVDILFNPSSKAKRPVTLKSPSKASSAKNVGSPSFAS